MATKKAVDKKRKGGTSPAPKAKTASVEGEAEAVLGEVSIPVLCSVSVPQASTFDELVIEWSCLGLSEEPDSIRETSGNHMMLDSDRPPATDDEGLHVFFKPPLQAGNYGFQFVFTYNSAVEARTAEPKKVEQLEKEREEFQGAEA
jgi:hypothetical protein